MGLLVQSKDVETGLENLFNINLISSMHGSLAATTNMALYPFSTPFSGLKYF